MAKKKWPKEVKPIVSDIYGVPLYATANTELFEQMLEYLNLSGQIPTLGKGGLCALLEHPESGDQMVVMWLSEKNHSYIAHECLHATLYVADTVGLDRNDDEALCYLHGFFVKKVTETLWPN